MGMCDAALVIAGIVRSTGAIVHGVLTQHLMVRPIQELAAGKLSPVRSEGWWRALALDDVQLVHRWACIAHRCIFIREGGKTGDGLVSRKLLPVWSSRQPLGDPGPPCGMGPLCRCGPTPVKIESSKRHRWFRQKSSLRTQGLLRGSLQ